ncbi:MAG: fibronectin type III domain-containing protein, partial [Bacteroidota bacterium]
MKSFTTKIFFSLFVLALSLTGIYGQSPVTASVSLSDPSPYLEDYMQPGRLLATLVSTDQRPTYAVRLQFSIEAGGQRILLPGDPTFAPVVELTRGLPLVLQGEDLRPYFDLNFLDPPTRERILALGNELPAGPVTICLAAFDLNFLASPPVSNTACGMGIIDLHQPPLLVAPTSVSSSADVSTSTPQAINFSWQPQHFFASEYRLEIWADDLGFGNNFLIENVPPLVQINTLNTSYLLTDIDPILEAGVNYVWRVQASDLADRERFINDGFSELGRFRMVAPEPDLPPVPCGMPSHLTYQLIDEQTVSLSWTPANDLPHTLDLGSMDDPAYLSSSIGTSAGTIGSEAPFGSSGQEESSPPDLPSSSTGSYTWTNLEASYEYYVYVCAPCPGNTVPECRFLSFEMPDLASCAPNILAQMGQITPTSVQFSWTSDPTWTDHYSIHIGMDSMYLPPNSQETTCGSLNPDTDYVARICAHCPAGAGQNCVEYSFRTTDFRCATTAEIEELVRITTLPPDGIRIDWSELPAEVLEPGPDIAISPEYEGPEIADRPAESGQNQDFTGLEPGQTYTITFCVPCGEEELCVTRDITIPLCEQLVLESFDSRYVFHDRAEVFWGLPQVATIDSFRLRLRTEGSSVWLAQSPGIIGQMESFRFDQLTPNTTYVAELCPICNREATNCEELTFTTTAVVCDRLGDDSEFEYICGDQSDLLPFEASPLLQQLRPGDSIWVADFKMEILEVSSLSSPWAGRGRTAVPYLNGALVEFTFSAIEINENCRLTAGELEAVPPWAELVTDLQNTLNDAQDLLSNLTGTIEDLSTALGLVEDVADMLATLQELQVLMQQDPENFPPELQDQLQEAIDCLTNPDIVDKSVCEELIEDVIAGLEELQSALYDADYQVDFLPAEEMIYGYDTLSYPEMNIRDWYIQVPDIDERPYTVAWKSVPQGQSDYVQARRDPAGPLDSVRFVYQDLDSEVGNPTPMGDDRVLAVDFASSPTVYARQVRPSDGGSSADGLGGGSGPEVESLIAGQLALVEYPEKELNVVLVPLNGASASFDLNDPTLADELQRIYRPAIVETNLSVYPTPFQVDGVDVIPDQASGVRSYPQPLRRIIEAFEDQHPDLDEDTYYLFVCQTFAGDEAGFMPRKRQFGFLYLNNAPTEPIAFARLIGHELGHGAYHLQHPWQETTLPESATDNLMDYAGGGRLHKWQWDLIDDPVAVAGLFEGDGDGSGEVVDCQYDMVSGIIDSAELLLDDEELELWNLIIRVKNRHGINVIIKTFDYLSNPYVLTENGCSIEENTNRFIVVNLPACSDNDTMSLYRSHDVPTVLADSIINFHFDNLKNS